MLTLEEYEKLNPRCEVVHDGVSILYTTPNQHTKWRVDSLFEKEPIIEVNQNLPDHMQMVEELSALGFSYDREQVGAAERKSGAFKGCAEYVFRR
jgi:hypothetical protein